MRLLEQTFCLAFQRFYFNCPQFHKVENPPKMSCKVKNCKIERLFKVIFKHCVSLQNPVYALNPGNEVANFLMPSQVFLNSSCCLRYSSYGLVLGAIMLIWVDTFARLKCVTASFCGCCGGGASVTPWALTSQVAWFKPTAWWLGSVAWLL